MATTKQSAETIDLIKKMYLAGASYRQIGAWTLCGMSTIVNIVKAAGLPPRGKARPKPVTPEQLEAIASVPESKAKAPTKRKPAKRAKPAPKAKSKPAPKAKRATKRTVKHPTLKVGTVIKKLDRDGHMRARCTVTADGFRYAGKVYPSISSAAMAAMKNLRLNSKAVNGYVWWGIAK